MFHPVTELWPSPGLGPECFTALMDIPSKITSKPLTSLWDLEEDEEEKDEEEEEDNEPSFNGLPRVAEINKKANRRK